MSKIAFIGLGNMGGPMASNLARAGHELSVFDLSSDASARVAQAGSNVKVAASAAATLAGAEFVISMLPASAHVEALYLGKGAGTGDSGIIEQIGAGALVIDCSTIAPASAQKVARAAHARGLAMIDAPVSGGTAGATAATLTFIVGGGVDALARGRPVLEQMGKNIFHAGDSGAGQTAKICNNMLLAIQMIGTAEALALGVANGLDPKVLSDIIGKSSGRNWVTELYNPYPGVMPNVPASNGYAGGFGVDLMLKDLGLALEAALATRASVPLGANARNLYAMHSQSGAGALDYSSILGLLQKKPA